MKIIYTLLLLLFSVNLVHSQNEHLLTLEEKIEQSRIVWLNNRQIAEEYANKHNLPILSTNEDEVTIELHSIADNGIPIYYITHNRNAAKTVGANLVYSGGGAGLSLSGDGVTLGIWDAGGVRTTHQEFSSSRATQRDGSSGTHYHATHVGCTMIGSGEVVSAKGMAYEADLDCYDWNSDVSEMRSAASNGLKISNHSYGHITGWYRNGDWYWWGDPSVSSGEDANFGYYSYITQDFDDVAYDYPNFLICVSAGNDRGEGPSSGTSHKVWNNGWVWSTATREKDGGNDGYDCLSHISVAKNLMIVGAVNDITNGYDNPSDVSMSTFSCWGPTDDGRIKPDIVANGISLYSAINSSNSSYTWMSGTSMACPNTSGALGLLLEHHKNLHGSSATMRSATLKGIAIHTAYEAGSNDGPDYQFGWGLLNIQGAAELMTTNADRNEDYDIQELNLSGSETEEITGYSDGSTPIKVTICWTDPAASLSSLSLNNRTSKLVNDLDLRIIESSNTYYPYKLSYSNPGNAATTGDNDVDNVEQVYFENPDVGTYTIRINHEGSLTGGSQNFSIMITGLEPLSEPIITSQPEDSQICPGSSTYFTAYVSGEVDEFLWSYSDDDGSSWFEASDSYHYSGNTTSSLTVSNVSGSMNGYQYKLRVENSYGTTYTDPAELGIYQNATITSHPMNQDITSGDDTYFSVIAVGGSSYKWQVSTNTGDTWSYVSNGGVYSNALTSTINLNNVPLSFNGYMYRAEVSNICGFETYSNAADINVDGYIEIFWHPENYTSCIGEDSYQYAVIIGDPEPTLQWQVSTDDGLNWDNLINNDQYSDINTNTLTIYNPSEDMQDYLYRLSGTNSVGSVQTNSASIILEDELVVATNPGDATVSAGDDHTFIADVGDPIELNWQKSTDNGSSWDWLENNTIYSGVYTQSLYIEYITADMNGYLYRLVGFNTCPDGATTDAAELTVETSLSITSNPDDTEVCRENQAFFECTIESNPAPELQWQLSTDNGNTWTGLLDNDIYDGTATETLEIISTYGYMDGYDYRLYATNNSDEAVSESANLHIIPIPQITEDASDQTACEGGEAIFQVQVDGENLSYQWHYSSDFGDTWVDIINNSTFAGATSNTLTVNNVSIEMTSYYFLCLIQNNCDEYDNSDIVMIELLDASEITNPTDQQTCFGGSTVFSTTVSGSGELSLNWQRSTNNGTNWANISDNDIFSGATTSFLSLENVRDGFDGNLFRIRVISDCGTSYSQSADLSVTNEIQLDSGDDEFICYGSEIQLNATADGGTGIYEYSWSPITGLDNAEVANPIANPTETTVYSLTVTDSEGCIATDEIVVEVNPELFVNAGDDEFICFGSEVQINATADGGTGIYDYSWSPISGLDNAEVANPIANPTETTVYSLTVTDSEGCVATDEIVVEVNPELFVNAGDDEFICYGSEVQLNATADGGSEIYDYSWSPITGLDNAEVANPIANPSETTIYSLTVTDSEGCVFTDMIRVAVFPLPNPVISGDEEVNSHSTHEYFADVSETMEIKWLVDGGVIDGSDNDETVAIEWGTAGIGKVKLILTNIETGCRDSAEVEIQINLLISLSSQWNLISTYLEPESLDIVDIFEEIVDDVLLVRDGNNNIYFPELNINNINEWDMNSGYEVYMYNANNLIIKGDKIEPDSFTLFLNEQWNILPYLRDDELNISIALDDINDQILIVRDISGNIYFPQLSINTIGNMIPTKAYDIYVTDNVELVYPENDYNPRAIRFDHVDELPEPIYLRTNNKATSEHNTIIVKLSEENDGEELGVYNIHGKILSSAVVFDGMAILTIWGDDNQTSLKEGPQENEPLFIKVLDKKSNELKPIDNIILKDLRSNIFLTELQYQKGGVISIISMDMNISDQIYINASPNPVINSTIIKYYIPQSGDVDISLYSTDGMMIEKVVDSYNDAGTYSCFLDVKLIPSGKYNLVLKQNDKIESISLMIVK